MGSFFDPGTPVPIPPRSSPDPLMGIFLGLGREPRQAMVSNLCPLLTHSIISSSPPLKPGEQSFSTFCCSNSPSLGYLVATFSKRHRRRSQSSEKGEEGGGMLFSRGISISISPEGAKIRASVSPARSRFWRLSKKVPGNLWLSLAPPPRHREPAREIDPFVLEK